MAAMDGVNQELLAATVEQLTGELRTVEQRVNSELETYVVQHQATHAQLTEWLNRQDERIQGAIITCSDPVCRQ